METYKQEFIEFMVRSNVLTFGDFVTKSGRSTPFFINTGNYDCGNQLLKLGEFYAASIQEHLGDSFDVLYGPAYKGIPLAVAASMALASKHGKNVSFCFNRKEAKDHGEGGSLVGHKLKIHEKVVIVEDVITAGTSVRESIPTLQAAAQIQISGIVVSVDRMEKGQTNRSALSELRQEFGLNVFAIVTLDEVTSFLHNREIDGKVVLNDSILEKIKKYREIYGAE